MTLPQNYENPPLETTVVIIGAGPSGLSLACRLAQDGIDHVLIDRDESPITTTRAALLHARTLEALDELRVARRLRQHGVVVPTLCVRDGDRKLAEIDFGCLASKYPFAVVVPQSTTEAVLEERLEELGSGVTRPWNADTVTQGRDSVTVEISRTLADGQVEHRVIRASYAVGCDGMYSTVREDLAIDTADGGSEESYVVADVHFGTPPKASELSLFLSPEGLLAVEPLPGDRHRIVASVPEASRLPRLEDVRALVERRGPRRQKLIVSDVTFSARFQVRPHIARSFRSGRVFLVGDAAHVHGPTDAHGVNLGIQDAVCLGGKLARSLANGDQAVLDEYERERRPRAQAAAELASIVERGGALANPFSTSLRNLVLGTACLVPAVRRQLAKRLSGTERLEPPSPDPAAVRTAHYFALVLSALLVATSLAGNLGTARGGGNGLWSTLERSLHALSGSIGGVMEVVVLVAVGVLAVTLRHDRTRLVWALAALVLFVAGSALGPLGRFVVQLSGFTALLASALEETWNRARRVRTAR